MTGSNDDYSRINMKQTGVHLKKLVQENGYTVKGLQELLHLSCPQPIYRWFRGQALPSVDHLFVMSRLFGIHMEELLVEETVSEGKVETLIFEVKRLRAERFWKYLRRIQRLAA